jgi:hypothetical protein
MFKNLNQNHITHFLYFPIQKSGIDELESISHNNEQ